MRSDDLVIALQEYLESPTDEMYDQFNELFRQRYPEMELLDMFLDDNQMVIEYKENHDGTD